MLTASTSNVSVIPAYTAGTQSTSSSADTSFSQVLANNAGFNLSGHMFRNGQISVDMHADGKRINSVSYYDASGQKLTSSGFWPQDILRNSEKFNIPLADLKGVGEQLDAAGVGYRPYEQYAGTGSNHGIDFDNLIAGGMGTAYDWTADPLVHLKGPAAADQLKADQTLAERLGLKTPTTSQTSSNAALGLGASLVPAAAASHATASPVSALDELLQLITQVKASLQSTSPTAEAASTPTTTGTATTAAAKPASAATSQTVETTTTQRLAQMKSFLELLVASR